MIDLIHKTLSSTGEIKYLHYTNVGHDDAMDDKHSMNVRFDPGHQGSLSRRLTASTHCDHRMYARADS